MRVTRNILLIIVLSAIAFARDYDAPGTVKWTYKTAGDVCSSPAIGEDGTIYFGSLDGCLYALSPNGELKWRYGTTAQVYSSPAIWEDGTIYFGSEDCYLYSLTQEGKLKWKFYTGLSGRVSGVISSPAVGDDGTIYIGSQNWYFYAINPQGKLEWKFITGWQITSSPAVGGDGTVYFGSGDNNLYALSPDGKLKWKFKTEKWIYSSPVIGKDGTIYFGSFDCYFYAVTPEGSQKWRFKTAKYIKSSAVIGNQGTIYFGSDDEHVYAISPEGIEQWRFRTEGKIRSSPVVGEDGTIYFGSGDNNLYALSPEGKLKWRYKTEGCIYSSPVVGSNGVIYFGSDDNCLYALQGDSKGLALTPWPMFHQDLRHLGCVSGMVVDDVPIDTIIKRNNLTEERGRKDTIDVEKIPLGSFSEFDNGLCVIFGIEDYKYAPRASFAKRDAKIFYEYAKSFFRFPERNIYLRTNEDASKGEFDKVFSDHGWLARRVEKGKSDIIFYFSGHGAPDFRTNKPYLIPWDIDPNYASTAFPISEIYKSLSELGARSVTVFLDACFSGQSKGELLFTDARPLISVEIETPSKDISVFTASTNEQISSVSANKKHGLFTYYLLKGLQGYGDLDGDKAIRVGELFDYLKENVSREAGFMDREQVPQLLSGDRNRVLVKTK